MVWAAHAQFTEIAASDDGSQVYVTTQFVIDGVQSFVAQPRIFQITGGKVNLVAQASMTGPGGTIDGPEVSADGTVAGYSLSNLCSDNICSIQYAESYLNLPSARDLGIGKLRLSRNGRWALLASANFAGTGTGSANLIDLQGGTTTNIAGGPTNNWFGSTDNWSVASDGSVLTGDTVWKAGQTTTLSILTLHASVALSDDGSTVIFTASIPGSGTQLIAHNVASGQEILIAESGPNAAVPLPSPLSVSANGRFVLYNTTGLVSGALVTNSYIADTIAGTSYPLPLNDGENMTAGVLNGSATSAFIATSQCRLLQVTLSAGQPGAVTPILAQTLYLANGLGLTTVAAGSLVRLTGSVTGTVDSLQGKISLNNLPMPILGVSGTNITAQVPWEVRAGQTNFQIDLPSQSPFYPSAGSVVVLSIRPQFETADVRTPFLAGFKFITEDFSGPATNPLPAGAILHAYMTGLGPVSGPVTTGVPASATTLNPIQGTLSCQFLPQASAAQTLFAGLAPGLIGIYQVDFQLANEGSPVTVTGLTCTETFQGQRATFSAFSAGTGVVPPAPQ